MTYAWTSISIDAKALVWADRATRNTCETSKHAKEILKGNTTEVQRQMRDEMIHLAEELRFEEAQELKRKYDLIENFRAKSQVVSNVMHNIDVFNIESEERVAYINYLHVTNGCINQAFTFEFKKRLDESDEELLTLGIIEMRERYQSKSKEIVVPFPVDLPDGMVEQTIPQKGDKRKLLDLSQTQRKAIQIRPPQASRKVESGTEASATDEGNPKRPWTPQTTPSHRTFRQFQHQWRGCCGGMRGV